MNLDLLFEGFEKFFTLSSFVYMNIGLLLGVIFGSIPGLTVLLCIILFLPFTYYMDAIDSFMFLLGIYCAGSYGGSISAILIKTPGTPHAAATMLDGHPLSQMGFPNKAIKLALNASTFGGIFSAFVLLFLAPVIAIIALKFGPPEYFVLCLFGLTIIAGVSGESMCKGIITCCFGLFCSTVGMDQMEGVFRFTLGSYNLMAGLSLVIVLIGLFALSEVIIKTVKNATDSQVKEKNEIDSAMENAKQDSGKLSRREYRQILPHMLRSSIIGVIIGAIPGTGASMASFLSYDRAKKSSRMPKMFGHGSIEGIVAAEAANNAVTGATLIPLLTLGIPGDAVVAILLGSLMINGLTPGPNLFEEHGVTVYAIMIGLIFINIFMYLQGKFLTKYFAKITKIPSAILSPAIVIFCFAGAFSINNSPFDILITVIFGIIAYLLLKFDFPIVPILLGIVLGQLAENNLRRSLVIANGSLDIFFTRPISLIFIVILVITIIYMFRKGSGKQANEA